MKTFKCILFMFLLISGIYSCEKDAVEIPSRLQDLKATKYYDAEIFAESDLKIYGLWELFAVSGGLSGSGHDINFEYLEIKGYGIYGFVNQDSLLEYGKISHALQPANITSLKVDFEKDEKSNSFFTDTEKYIEFMGEDTLSLNSPCCDRFNYHFKRVK